jgi:putative ABC transport system ATP-binding protein
MLDRVGLANRASSMPIKLSGGELRRVALARALATERPIVLAEEPIGQVDPATAKALLELIREINSQSGTTFIVVTDSESLAREATRTIRLDEGRVAYDHSRSFSPLFRP